MSITVSFPERLYIKNTQMLSPVYQYVINLVVSFHLERSRCVYESFGVKHCALDNQTFFVWQSLLF